MIVCIYLIHLKLFKVNICVNGSVPPQGAEADGGRASTDVLKITEESDPLISLLQSADVQYVDMTPVGQCYCGRRWNYELVSIFLGKAISNGAKC